MRLTIQRLDWYDLKMWLIHVIELAWIKEVSFESSIELVVTWHLCIYFWRIATCVKLNLLACVDCSKAVNETENPRCHVRVKQVKFRQDTAQVSPTPLHLTRDCHSLYMSRSKRRWAAMRVEVTCGSISSRKRVWFVRVVSSVKVRREKQSHVAKSPLGTTYIQSTRRPHFFVYIFIFICAPAAQLSIFKLIISPQPQHRISKSESFSSWLKTTSIRAGVLRISSKVFRFDLRGLGFDCLFKRDGNF